MIQAILENTPEISKLFRPILLSALKVSNWPGVRLATLTAPGGVGPGSDTNTTFFEAPFDANLIITDIWGVLLASRWCLISRHQHLWNFDWEGIWFVLGNLHLTWQQYYSQFAPPATFVLITAKDMLWPQRPSSTLMSNLKLGETQKMTKQQ